MKRFQSAFAAPSGFVVAATVGQGAKRRAEGARATDLQASPAAVAKTRARDVRNIAA